MLPRSATHVDTMRPWGYRASSCASAVGAAGALALAPRRLASASAWVAGRLQQRAERSRNCSGSWLRGHVGQRQRCTSVLTRRPAMPEEPHKRPTALSNGSAACSDVTSAEPKKEKKKTKKKRTQDHEVCAGTGTLDQLFLGFLLMTICLFVAVWYLWKVRLPSPCALLSSQVAPSACNAWQHSVLRDPAASSSLLDAQPSPTTAAGCVRVLEQNKKFQFQRDRAL